jgi:4-amino-4-deoxy-L-arabinose transferase-like glycosyltransferase
MRLTPARIAAVLFLAIFGIVLAFHGNRIVPTNDEGIVLESAQRMAQGARPYVDFFGYMSPGSYWMQALVFRLFGISLWAGRLIVIADFSLQCALLFWLVARLSASRIAAAIVLLVFAGFQIADPSLLTAQHRWDSGTLALAGLCLLVERRTKFRAVASGILLAAAAWCTPSMALVGGVAVAWFAISRERRESIIPFLGGAVGISAAAVAALAATGSLAAFFHQMVWLQQNYSSVNVLPYGSIIGGYRALLQGTSGIGELMVRIVVVICVALPAILPPLAMLVWGVSLWRGTTATEDRAAVQLLLFATAGLVLTTFPRADVMHLAFIAALPYALAGGALARILPNRAAFSLAMVSLLMATVFSANYFRGWRDSAQVHSPAGVLRVPLDEVADVERLMAEVHPGEGLFVYPYMPLDYFLTQTRNPTRFSYLAPGMMTRTEELETLAELQAQPPEWLLYLKLTPEEFLRVFPHASGLNWRFDTIEEWLRNNYQPVEGPSVNVAGYGLWRRNPQRNATLN